MSERNGRKVYVDRIVSDKMDKAIAVLVEAYRAHKLYGKQVEYFRKYKTHDEDNSAKLGDIVRIQEICPLSASERFRLVGTAEESVII